MTEGRVYTVSDLEILRSNHVSIVAPPDYFKWVDAGNRVVPNALFHPVTKQTAHISNGTPLFRPRNSEDWASHPMAMRVLQCLRFGVAKNTEINRKYVSVGPMTYREIVIILDETLVEDVLKGAVNYLDMIRKLEAFSRNPA